MFLSKRNAKSEAKKRAGIMWTQRETISHETKWSDDDNLPFENLASSQCPFQGEKFPLTTTQFNNS